MPLPSKKLLIINYAFPPYPGIGGRRWAKFSKHLQQAGYEIFVISSHNPFNKISDWTKDTGNVKLSQLPLNYPKSLITYPKGTIGKIEYRLAKMKVKLFSKGNYYDRSIFWKKQLLDKASKIIQEHQIETLIVSAAPFRLLQHCANLKKDFPNLKLIADIRDPWTNNHTSYGFETMSKSRLKFEQATESSVFNFYNKVITVSETISTYFKILYPQTKEKFLTIENGYDADEMKLQFDETLHFDKEKINLVFTGSFYSKADYLFRELIASMLNGGLEKLQFYFFGDGSSRLSRMLPDTLKHQFVFGEYNKVEQVNSLIERADYAMLFLSDDINYSLSTKFCEYIKFKKKILVFSKPGYTGDYIEKHGIGFQLNPQNMHECLLNITSGNLELNQFPTSFNLELFSVKRLTGKLIEVIEGKDAN